MIKKNICQRYVRPGYDDYNMIPVIDSVENPFWKKCVNQKQEEWQNQCITNHGKIHAQAVNESRECSTP